jgi:DNA-binding CsgD family transcriptional regulator
VVEMQPTLSLPSANGRAPDRAAPSRVAIEIADPGLAAVLVAELALTPGLALVRRGERADLVISDRPDGHGAHRMLLLGNTAGRSAGANVSVLGSREPRLITAAAMLLAAGYRLEPDMDRADAAVVVMPPSLTAREQQVAELLVEGASNKVIARRLGISVHTAKFHVGAVLDKLGAHNRSDAVAIALRDGLVAL